MSGLIPAGAGNIRPAPTVSRSISNSGSSPQVRGTSNLHAVLRGRGPGLIPAGAGNICSRDNYQPDSVTQGLIPAGAGNIRHA